MMPFEQLIPEIANAYGASDGRNFAYSRIVHLFDAGLVKYMGNGRAQPFYDSKDKGRIIGMYSKSLPEIPDLEDVLDAPLNQGHSLLSLAGEQVALARVRTGDRAALDYMVVKNKRLVDKIANDVYSMQLRFDPSLARSMDFCDFEQFGFMGLHRALKKYRSEAAFERGESSPYKFSTFATLWIKQRIDTGSDCSRSAVRLPRDSRIASIRIAQAQELLVKRGSEPTIEELSSESGITAKKMARIINARRTFSLDKPLADGLVFADIVKDPDTSIDEQVVSETLSAALGSAISTLNAREQEIICRHFGLGRPAETLRTIAQDYGYTAEWVRQVEMKALGRLRRSMRDWR